jgi:hypothetical protein
MPALPPWPCRRCLPAGRRLRRGHVALLPSGGQLAPCWPLNGYARKVEVEGGGTVS